MKTRFYILLSMTLLLLTQTSCVNDNDIPCGSEDPDLLVINLNLTVPSSSTATRSAGDDLIQGSKEENYINIKDKDYQVLMFDKDGILVEGKLSEFECRENGINGGMTSYTLTTKLSLSDNEDKERLSTFRVMVLANWESFERSNTAPEFVYPSFDGYDLSGETNNIYEEREKFNFTFAEPTTENPKCWMPSIDDKRAIPMFGISEEVDLQFAMAMAKYGDDPSFTVPMLRSLAKIEIVNNTPEEDNIIITSCKLTAYNTVGRFIPDEENAKWNKNDNDYQIENPSLPKDYDSGQLDGKEWPLVSLDDGKTFVAYIPEMDLDKIKEQGGVEIPQVELMVTANGNEYGPYPIDLGKYEGEFTGEHYHALLRNHKYAFNINSVTVGVTGELTLLIDTENWDNDDDTYYYDDLEVKFADASDNGGSDGKFKWQWAGNNIYIDDPAFDDLNWDNKYNNQNIADWPNEILAQWTGKYLAVQHSDESGAIATFNITAPERGSWTLALYSDDGTPKHWFYIQRWDPETEEWVNEDQRADPDNDHNEVYDTLTGEIAGKGKTSSEVKIRITASQLQYTEKVYSARLVMNVTTFDGRMAEVNLLTGAIMDSTKTSDNDYYHIVQIPTPTS